MADIAACPHCSTRVIPTATGACPACGKLLSAAPVAAAAPVPAKQVKPINKWLFMLCVIFIAAGFGRYVSRGSDQQFEKIIIDLGLIWIGTIGIVAVHAVRWFK